MKKKVFWRKDDSGKDYHLRFVISGPDAENRVMVVNMTTIRRNGREDLSCVLVPGDHPCVINKSYIPYNLSLDLDYIKLIQEKFKAEIQIEEDASEETLLKIQAGARKTNRLPERFKRFFDYF